MIRSMEFPMGRDKIIETYVQRLLNWKEPITADSLSAIAQEVGLGPDDMAAVQQKAQDHFDRGRNYLDFDCLDEAIDELSQATALDPLNFEILQTLTYAYDQRYAKRKKAEDKQQAIALAKRCLEISPNNEEAVMLISALEHEAVSRQRILWLGLAAVLLFGGFKLVTDIIVKRSEVEQLTQEITLANPDGQTAVKPDVSAPEATGDTDIAPDTAAQPERSIGIEIPIIFEQPGLTLEPRLSRLDNYEESSYYTLQGVFLNESTQEIDTLRVQVDYLDKDGVAIATDSKNAIDSSDATVRPGDYHAVDLVQKVTPDLSTVRLSVITIEESLELDYTPSIPIDYTWGFKQPTQLTFDLVARSEDLKVYEVTDSAYFDAEWAVTNTSEIPMRTLKLQADFYNTLGELILSQDVLVVYGSDTPMLPGEVRPVRVIKSIDKDYDRYEVKVLEAE